MKRKMRLVGSMEKCWIACEKKIKLEWSMDETGLIQKKKRLCGQWKFF
ncbi:hypothetical protein [Neobacillus mesonae]|nr:hypothetical protein [Neobacillus mesonae]MCM3570840.1 hypothetical protein [Neobacillus mesonae]